MTSNHACSLFGPRSSFYNFSVRNFFWSTCPHPANETGYLSNQYPAQEQHLLSTLEGLDIGTSFLPLSLNGEPILLCCPHTMNTQHCKNTVPRCWYFFIPSYVCWWCEQQKPPNMNGSNTRSLVAPGNFSKFLAVLLIVLIDPAIPCGIASVHTMYVQVADVRLSSRFDMLICAIYVYNWL